MILLTAAWLPVSWLFIRLFAWVYSPRAPTSTASQYDQFHQLLWLVQLFGGSVWYFVLDYPLKRFLLFVRRRRIISSA
jgi:hypothetical protein